MPDYKYSNNLLQMKTSCLRWTWADPNFTAVSIKLHKLCTRWRNRWPTYQPATDCRYRSPGADPITPGQPSEINTSVEIHSHAAARMSLYLKSKKREMEALESLEKGFWPNVVMSGNFLAPLSSPSRLEICHLVNNQRKCDFNDLKVIKTKALTCRREERLWVAASLRPL